MAGDAARLLGLHAHDDHESSGTVPLPPNNLERSLCRGFGRYELKTLLAFGVLIVAAGGVELRATLNASDERAATAAEWSSDDAQFV